jgi:hypothetical protein
MSCENFCVTACQLIDLIRTECGDLLGAYYYDNPQNGVPAIGLDSQKNDREIIGCEVIVVRLPRVSTTYQGDYQQKLTFTVHIIQQDDSIETMQKFDQLYFQLSRLSSVETSSTYAQQDSIALDPPTATIRLSFFS